MAEADLASYQLQLQQVEAALLADPESGELQKLKDDLLQVIELTRELITAAEPQQSATAVEDQPTTSAAATTTSSYHQPVKHWQVGEQCRALWPKDGAYYEATITEIYSSGKLTSCSFATLPSKIEV